MSFMFPVKPGDLVRIRPTGEQPSLWDHVNRLFHDRVFLVIGCDPEHPDWIVVLTDVGTQVKVGEHRLEVLQ